MPARVANAIILRTYPLKEADSIVSFFTREYGKGRGVAHSARRSRRRFGAALEPLTQVRIEYFEQEGRELCRLDRCEIVASMTGAAGATYATTVGLAYIVETADRLLPEHEVNDHVFRLLVLVLEQIRRGQSFWPALDYYLYWMVRLGGFLPDLSRCLQCGATLGEEAEASFDRQHTGLHCRGCRPMGGFAISGAARRWAARIARTSLAELSDACPAPDLRLFLHQRIEDHLEGALKSWALLEPLGRDGAGS